MCPGLGGKQGAGCARDSGTRSREGAVPQELRLSHPEGRIKGRQDVRGILRTLMPFPGYPLLPSKSNTCLRMLHFPLPASGKVTDSSWDVTKTIKNYSSLSLLETEVCPRGSHKLLVAWEYLWEFCSAISTCAMFIFPLIIFLQKTQSWVQFPNRWFRGSLMEENN